MSDDKTVPDGNVCRGFQDVVGITFQIFANEVSNAWGTAAPLRPIMQIGILSKIAEQDISDLLICKWWAMIRPHGAIVGFVRTMIDRDQFNPAATFQD